MIKVYIDGASAGDPGPSGAGIYMNVGNGDQEHYRIPLGQRSNHHAEFEALIHALDLCIKKEYRNVLFHTDSQLVESSIDKRYVKKEEYATLLAQALELIDQFDLFFIKWVPSHENKTADELAKKAIHLN